MQANAEGLSAPISTLWQSLVMEIYAALFALLFFVSAGVFTLLGVDFKRGASVINYLLGLVGIGVIILGLYAFIFLYSRPLP